MASDSRRFSLLLGVLGVGFLVAGLFLYVRQIAHEPAAGPSSAATPQAPPVDLTAKLPFDASIATGTLKNGLTLLRPRQSAAGASGRAPAGRQRRVGPRGRRSARAGAFRRAHGVQRDQAVSEAPDRRLHGVGRHAVRSRRERGDRLRRHGLPAADSDRPAGRAGAVADDPRGLGAPGDVRSRRRSRGSGRSSSRSGARAWAPGRDCRTSCFRCWCKGSRYADRTPIGTPESISTFKPERLKQFYQDWYRPDLMAVIAVGDFDQAAVAALDRAAVRGGSGAGQSASAPGDRGAGAARHGVRGGRRPRSDGDDRVRSRTSDRRRRP